jgi:tetratricopeptide (TPR) repeat protein
MALKCYNKALKLYPDYYPVLKSKADLYYEMDKYTKSLNILNNISILFPDKVFDEEYYISKGKCLHYIDINDAINNFNLALKCNPENSVI